MRKTGSPPLREGQIPYWFVVPIFYYLPQSITKFKVIIIIIITIIVVIILVYVPMRD